MQHVCVSGIFIRRKRLLDYEKKRVELRHKYFDRFSREMSPKMAAEFVQLEIQIENMN